MCGTRLVSMMALLLPVAAAVTGCATVADCGTGDCSSDALISSGVKALLDQHPALGPPGNLSVQTRNGTVYLFGLVDTVMEQQLVTAIAMQAPGVIRVINLTGISNGR